MIQSSVLTENSLTAIPGESLSAQNITEFIEACAKVLDENNVPKEPRYLRLPMWAVHILTHAKTKRGREFLHREQAVKDHLRGGARAAYVRSRRNAAGPR